MSDNRDLNLDLDLIESRLAYGVEDISDLVLIIYSLVTVVRELIKGD